MLLCLFRFRCQDFTYDRLHFLIKLFSYFQHTGLSGKIGDGKVVILRTSKQDGNPVIIVKDTGDGTTAEEITHRIKYTGYEY